MQLYLINILFFLIANFLISITIKKYTYEKFFIYVVIYFVIVNFVNLVYLQNIDLFTFQILFSVFVLFLYSGLYRSISVKIMVYLYLKKNNVNINSFYKNEFKEKSFNKRIKILTSNDFLLKRGKNLILTKRAKKYLKIFKNVQSFYKIKFSG